MTTPPSTRTTYLVTGATRGIGHEFIRQLSSNPSNLIIGIYRSQIPSEFLNKPNIKFAQCHLDDTESINKLATTIQQMIGQTGKIDYLLNIAGILGARYTNSLDLNADSLNTHMATNVLAPAHLVKVLLPHLQEGSVVMNMSSSLGSLNTWNNYPKPSTVYSISKTSLNMLTVHQASDLRERGVAIFCVCPGHVKTDMGGPNAVVDVKDSVAGMLKILGEAGMEISGRFFDFEGNAVPW